METLACAFYKNEKRKIGCTVFSVNLNKAFYLRFSLTCMEENVENDYEWDKSFYSNSGKINILILHILSDLCAAI